LIEHPRREAAELGSFQIAATPNSNPNLDITSVKLLR
jgi:hypothetical protein